MKFNVYSLNVEIVIKVNQYLHK